MKYNYSWYFLSLKSTPAYRKQGEQTRRRLKYRLCNTSITACFQNQNLKGENFLKNFYFTILHFIKVLLAVT